MRWEGGKGKERDKTVVKFIINKINLKSADLVTFRRLNNIIT